MNHPCSEPLPASRFPSSEMPEKFLYTYFNIRLNTQNIIIEVPKPWGGHTLEIMARGGHSASQWMEQRPIREKSIFQKLIPLLSIP